MLRWSTTFATSTSATIATSTPTVIATVPTPTRRARRSRRRARGRRRPGVRRSPLPRYLLGVVRAVLVDADRLDHRVQVLRIRGLTRVGDEPPRVKPRIVFLGVAVDVSEACRELAALGTAVD